MGGIGAGKRGVRKRETVIERISRAPNTNRKALSAYKGGCGGGAKIQGLFLLQGSGRLWWERYRGERRPPPRENGNYLATKPMAGGKHWCTNYLSSPHKKGGGGKPWNSWVEEWGPPLRLSGGKNKKGRGGKKII